MGSDRRGQDARAQGFVEILTPSLLAVQFSSGIVLAAMALPAATLAPVTAAFEVYGVALAFVLLGAMAILLRIRGAPIATSLAYSPLVVQATVLAWGLAAASPFATPLLRTSFPVFATVAIAVTAALCPILFRKPRSSWKGWGGWAHLFLLILVPLVFALRVAASLGLGMAPGSGGALQGNWLLVNVPTILLEYFAFGMWLSLMLDPRSRGVRTRWDVWLSWVALLPILAALFASSLFAFVFSAVITWGTNLAVFVPVTWSLSLAAMSVACYLSFFLLLRRRGYRDSRSLFLGTASVLLSGFYPSVASVAGLSYGLVATTAAFPSQERAREV